MPQYSVRIKDLQDDTVHIVNVIVINPKDTSVVALKTARSLLGHGNLKVLGRLRHKPKA